MTSRIVEHGDGVAWMARAPLPPDHAIVTSLPDRTEVPDLGDGWAAWFVDTVALACRQVADPAVAIFFQTDVRHDGLWIDKGALVARAAERAGSALLFHRIVCRKPPGTLTFGRATYSHLLGFARVLRARADRARADVLPDAGWKPGTRSMGVRACLEACRFVRAETPTRTVVDPFCGYGTALAVANALGLDSVGVDLSARMCRRARRLEIDPATWASRADARAAIAQPPSPEAP